MPTSARRGSLRTCARCEWIFKVKHPEEEECPKCGFGHYGAHYVYGNRAYGYAKTQEPWKTRMQHDFANALEAIVNKSPAERKIVRSHEFRMALEEIIKEQTRER